MDCAAYDPYGDQPRTNMATLGQRYSDKKGGIVRYVKYTVDVTQGDALYMTATPWEMTNAGGVAEKVWGVAGADRLAGEWGYMQVAGSNRVTIIGSAAITADAYIGGSATAGMVTAVVVGTTTQMPCGQAKTASVAVTNALPAGYVILAFNN